MMMKSMFERGKQDANVDDREINWNNGQLLLQDIQEISKALYLNNAPSRPSFSSVHNRSKSAGKARLSKPQVALTPGFLNEDLLPKDKKLSSAWNWKKPLKALSRIGDQKFKCCFNLHVHSIQGLPLNFDGISLCVHWKRKNSILQTHPSRVLQGVVEFNETLSHGCSVYVSRAVSGHTVKYESKRFLIYASIVGATEHDLGSHQVDLTRLLPLTVAELGGDRSSAKWSTSFRLAGKAVGATLNVSFSYQVMKDELMEFRGDNLNVLNLINMNPGRPSGTSSVMDFSSVPFHSDDVILSREALQNSGSSLSKSISFLYQKLDEGNFHNSACSDLEQFGPLKSDVVMKSESLQESKQHEPDDTEFSFIEQVETLEGDSLKLDLTENQAVDLSTVEIINVDDIIKDDDVFVDKNTRSDSMDNICTSCVNGSGTMADDSKHKCTSPCVSITCIKPEVILPETSAFLDQEHCLNVESYYKAHRMTKRSSSLDSVTESIANDFLNMLAMDTDSFRSSCDGDPQSPREKLLRQFEKEALTSGSFTFDLDANEEELETDTLGHSCGDCTMDSDLSLLFQVAEEEHARENQLLIQRRNAKILDDLETDSLMRLWGLNERDFEKSLRTCSDGFGSPIELPNEEPPILPSIGQGLGSFVQIMGGGFLRSMSPSLFRSAKNCGNLVTQASNPVVLPAKMGNDLLEILLHVASDGVEELCDHICKLMPLQDMTGKSIEHIACEATTDKGAPPVRQGSWQHDLFEEFPCDYLADEGMSMDTVSLEAIAPMTVDKIEALLIDGLRIQSGMSYEEAPSYIHAQHSTAPATGGRRDKWKGFPTSQRVAKLQLEDGGETGSDDDGLMGLSITLDQWLRLDSGIISGYQNSEQILKTLKVHNSKITELDDGDLENAMGWVKTYGRKHGLLGNHVTVAFMIQLRDPQRNYEPVGVPMLVLTQVERVHIHAMQQDDSYFLDKMEKRRENEALLNETSSKSTGDTNANNEAPQFRFKIREIHLSGVLTKAGSRQLWGTATQRQSGMRWLLNNGMAGTVKHSSSTSKAIVLSSPPFTKKLQNEDILWSLSYFNSIMETNSKELPAENVHIRNPDIIFPS